MQFTSPVRLSPLPYLLNLLLTVYLCTLASSRSCMALAYSQDAAKASLELHGHELEPNLPLNVYISNPERKKERTDADANAREVYVSGLSKFAEKSDLEKIFKTVSLRCLCSIVRMCRLADAFCGFLCVLRVRMASMDLSKRLE